jgi:hypothetical protein
VAFSNNRSSTCRVGSGSGAGRKLGHGAELVGHHRQKLQPLEVEIHQFPQPVGTVEIGPFGAQDRQALALGTDLRCRRSTSRIAAWVRIVCE